MSRVVSMRNLKDQDETAPLAVPTPAGEGHGSLPMSTPEAAALDACRA